MFFLTLMISVNTFSNNITDTIQTNSKITDVTVFFIGAQVTRCVDLKAIMGKHLIIINKLSNEINPQSIQVDGINHCKILSVKHQLTYSSESKKSKDELELESKRATQELKIKEIKNKISVYDLEEALLIDNSLFSKKDGGTSVSEIKEAADFYRVRLNEIRQGKLDLSVELDAANKTIQELYVELNKLISRNHKNYSQILITIECEKTINENLCVSYYINSAGWTPLYDFRVDDITKPLTIVYNANVYQSSGESWDNVNIKLSTNNPSLSGNKPELNTWYLGRRNYYPGPAIPNGPASLQGIVSDAESNEAIPFANIALFQGNHLVIGATSDFDGLFKIKPIPSGYYDVRASFVGYKTVQINNLLLSPDKITFQDFKLKVSAETLESVEVIDYKVPLISKQNTSSKATVTAEEIPKMPGRSGSNIASTVEKVNQSEVFSVRGSRDKENLYNIEQNISTDIETSNYISNSLKANVANLEYDIEIPYTILSDGKDYSIKIKEVSLPVNYVYYAVPKVDNDVFLVAEIKDWIQLDLLSGKSNIYYQGTYTGESYINSDQTTDTLSLSLGRDRNVIVTRTGNKEMNDRRMIGGNYKETIGWDITVKNNKNASIKIFIEDQFPISIKKSIEVDLLEFTHAKVDYNIGKLTWIMQLEPNEKQVINYRYSVKYPKYVTLDIE